MVPELRFNNFDGSWIQNQISDIATIKRGASPRPITDPKYFSNNSSIGWVRISDVTKAKQYLDATDQYVSELGKHKSRYLPSGSMIMSICATIGKPIITKIDTCIHDGFVVFDQLKSDMNFFFQFLLKIQTKWYKYGQPGAQINLNTSIVNREKIFLPTFPEQQKIASFLSTVDNQIELLTKRKELLEQYKKGMMQKIFNQQIRFSGDGGNEFEDWKEQKLGEIFECKKGQGLSKDHLSIKGKHKCILYGELYTKYNEHVKKVVSATNIKGKVKSKYNDLLVPCSTTTSAIDLANVTALNVSNVLLGGDITILRSKHEINNVFYAYYLSNHKKLDLAKYGQGTTIVHLYYEHFKVMSIDLPCLAEQQKIANFLSSIDAQIDHVSNRLDRLKTWKKGLLQKMFV